MRISDWSSDVCSSDLPRHDQRLILRTGGFTPMVNVGRPRTGGPFFARRISCRNRSCRTPRRPGWRSEEHTSELQSLMRTSYAAFCLKTKKKKTRNVRRVLQATIETNRDMKDI